MVFVENPVVHAFLERSGEKGLPLVLVDGEIALAGRYPSRDELGNWCGTHEVSVASAPSESSCCKPGCC